MDAQLLRKYTKQFIDKNGNTLLHKAVKEKNLILLFKAATMETSVNKQNIDGYSALHYAVKHGDISMVESVLECGVSPLLKTKVGETAKDLAIRNRMTDIAKVLDLYGQGLEYYILYKDMSRAIDLLNKWVNLNNVVKSAMTTADSSVFCENLKGAGLDYYYHQNHFIHLVASDNYDEVAALLKESSQTRSININSVHSSNGATPLSLAIQNCNTKMVELLLSDGASATVRINDGTPLTHYAVEMGASFQVVLCLMRDENTWHMRCPATGLTILFSLARDPSITPVHIHKLCEVTQCAVLIDRDPEGHDIQEFCLNHNRLDIIDAIHESVAELLSKRTGKLTFIRLAVAFLGQTIINVPESIFRRIYEGKMLLRMLRMYAQFMENIPSLESEAEGLFDAVRRGDLSAVKQHNVADFINKHGRTALHEAILGDRFDIAVWLLAERPGLARIGDLNNRYPLHYAYVVLAQYGKKYIHLLMEHRDRADLENLTDLNNNIPSSLDMVSKTIPSERK